MASEQTAITQASQGTWTLNGQPMDPYLAAILEKSYAEHEAVEGFLAARREQMVARVYAPVDASLPSDEVVVLPSHDAADLLRASLELPRYDLDGLVAPGCITALGGYTGAGKTPFAVRLVRALLHADATFAGIPHGRQLPADYRVVYLTQESEYTFKPLLEGAGLSAELAAGRFMVVYLHEALAAGLTWQDTIRHAADLTGARGLLVVDPLSDWAMVRNEDDNAVMAEAFRPLIAAVGGGRSALVVVHAWKSFDTVPDDDTDVMHIRGAGAIVSNATIVALYKKPRERMEGGDKVRFLKVARCRFGDAPEPRYLELGDDGALHRVQPLQREARTRRAATDAVLSAIRAAVDEGVRHRDLPEKAGLDSRRVSDALEFLVEARLVTSRGKLRSKTDPLTWYPSEDVAER